MKRYLSLCLAVLLVLALLPTMALADERTVSTEKELADAIKMHRAALSIPSNWRRTLQWTLYPQKTTGQFMRLQPRM